MNGPVAVSLSPSAARSYVPDSRPGDLITMSQVNRPPLVLDTLHVPCACGRPLVGCDYAFGDDTIFVQGVCLSCGNQSAIFAPPREESETDKTLRMHLEIVDIVTKIQALRQPEDMTENTGAAA